ncbi:nuclear transport factor 2 family protein [Gryllotalpicola reticulitermitis]|uniref:Nuclear transport factor 2 family protein n=1 Tax=Gryllotalpicola reticulitermitis TaxID=1184153 RepID=A0ABV8QAE7_9MICO
MATEIPLDGVVAEHLRAVNSFDVDAIMATFAEDAYVNDARREIRGTDAVRRWVEKEMVGDHVTIDPVEVLDHYGDVIVRGRYDGDYDKTNLPDELILSNYFSIRNGKIVALAVIFNQPSEYDAPSA